MTKSLKGYYEKMIQSKIETIERHQMKMNANLGNPPLCLIIEKKQSILRVDILFIKRKLEMLETKYNKAA